MIKPGIYGIGSPDSSSHVFVTANYKLTFDKLRSSLSGVSAWILVLDTQGINVWCAAGKGTFGTDELIKKIEETSLKKLVKHKKLIVPQLGAPGISSHKVRKETGFTVIYGPVRASDIIDFLSGGAKASEEMRRVRFNLLNRLVLIPVEISIAFKYFAGVLLFFILLSGLSSSGFSIANILHSGEKALLFLCISFISGTIITPLLLPIIPGRAFSLKGVITGTAAFIIITQLYHGFNDMILIEQIAWFMMINTISSFLAMNFTGASTFTSLSGVKKEMKIAIPMQITGAAAGLILFIISKFV